MDLSSKLHKMQISILISPETQPMWKGEYSGSHFRRKLDKISEDAGRNGVKLHHVKDNLKRVFEVRSNPTVLMQLEQCKQDLIKGSVQGSLENGNLIKSADISNKLRQEANEFYKRKELCMAHKGFTLSLCFAPGESREMALAFSNRSACSMEMNVFDGCLQDIQMAMNIICKLEGESPTESQLKELQLVQGKLKERKSRCLLKLQSMDKENNLIPKTGNQTQTEGRIKIEKSKELFRLNNPSKVVLSAEDFVRIEDSVSRGRHVIVEKDVKPGTVLILEEPYSKVLVKQFKWETDFCHSCFKELVSMPSIPCPDCVFALYCSDSCLKSDQCLHDFDCKLADCLHKLSLNRLVLLAYRTLTKFGTDAIYNLWRNSTIQSQTSSGILGFDSSGRYVSSSYYPINCLIYHDENLSESELRQYCLDAILITELLDSRTNFFRSSMNENDEDYQAFKDFASSLLLLHQMNFPCNAHSLNALQFPNQSPTTEEVRLAQTTDYGAAAFALLSMINHSCDPNVTRVTLPNGLNAVVTIKSLKSGDEVLDNYGAHFALEAYSSRQKHLMGNYSFKCACIACQNNWPMMDVLQDAENTFVCSECAKNLTPENFKDCIINKSTSKCKKCQRKCKLESRNNDLKKYIKSFEESYQLVVENQPHKGYQNLVKCLKYFESHMLPPFITTNFTQETLKQALNLMGMYCLCEKINP